ncbi:MAG TPA: hypothetical protein VEF76_11980 [Patescibacteria group bacterium]|nr:hypothetical protein [Patescibacteria group bacterium]
MVALGGSKRVLMVGGEGVVLYAPLGKGIERETAISWEVPNFDEQLVEALDGKHRGKSVLVIFDGADQTYRKEENIPKLSPIDRPRFVKRKLELAFPSYPIRASLEIKAGGKGGKKQFIQVKKDETPRSYLFVALPETDQLDRIGNALYETGVPVSGFGLLPLESTGMVAELAEKVFAGQGKKSRWAVVIGQHETGGLRQVVVKDGNLALTRLTPTSEAGTSGTGWVDEVTREFKATLTYISRFGYTDADGLDVVVICGDVEKQFFDPKSLPVTHFQCVNAGEALRLLGAKSFGFEKTNFADAVHAAWAGKKGGLKLAVRVPSIHRIMAPRLAARAASGLLALGVIGLVGLTVVDLKDYAVVQSEINDKQNRKTMLDREYEQEAKVFDGLPVRPDQVKATLEVKKLAENNTMSLRAELNTLKNTLPSDVKIEEFLIDHTPGPAFKVGSATAAPSPLFSGFQESPDPNDRGQVHINFKFTLPRAMPADQKTLRADELQKALEAAFPGYTVALQQFGGVNRAEGNMTGKIGEPTSGAAPAMDAETVAEIDMRGKPIE